MTYSPETQALIDAITLGNMCHDCGAANHLPHFDECPQHPQNTGPA